MFERQGLRQIRLAVHMIRQGGKDNVRNHTTILCAVAVNAVELLNRQLERTEHRFSTGVKTSRPPTDINHRLDCSLPMGRTIADDQTTTIILNRSGENLRSTGTEFVHKDYQRTAV